MHNFLWNFIICLCLCINVYVFSKHKPDHEDDSIGRLELYFNEIGYSTGVKLAVSRVTFVQVCMKSENACTLKVKLLKTFICKTNRKSTIIIQSVSSTAVHVFSML